jgi:hypothetical protein
MNTEYDAFIKKLADVPEVPQSVFKAVTAVLRKQRAKWRLIRALAASVICALGIAGYALFSQQTAAIASRAPVSEEVEEELYCISDFANGYSLDEEIALYDIDEQ